MIKIYGGVRTRAFRCLWTLEELGAPYQSVPVDFRAGANREPDFLKKNPAGKIPVLEDGEFTLCESAAICTYLGDKYPEKGLTPAPHSADRAIYDQWLFFITTELEQGLWTMAKHKFALPESKRIPQMKEIGQWEFTQAARVLNVGLKDKSFLIGDTFSVADIMAGHTLLWAIRFDVSLGYPRLESYLERLQQRPAFQATTQKR